MEMLSDSWNTFIKTGRIDSYLNYKDESRCTENADEREREQWGHSEQKALL